MSTSWVKTANRIGSYDRSYRGFRIYWKKRPQRHTTIEDRADGRYRVVEFIQGEIVTVNKEGHRIESPHMDMIYLHIDIYRLNEYYDRREAKRIH